MGLIPTIFLANILFIIGSHSSEECNSGMIDYLYCLKNAYYFIGWRDRNTWFCCRSTNVLHWKCTIRPNSSSNTSIYQTCQCRIKATCWVRLLNFTNDSTWNLERLEINAKVAIPKILHLFIVSGNLLEERWSVLLDATVRKLYVQQDPFCIMLR